MGSNVDKTIELIRQNKISLDEIIAAQGIDVYGYSIRTNRSFVGTEMKDVSVRSQTRTVTEIKGNNELGY